MLNAEHVRGAQPRIRPAEAVPYLVSDLAVVRALQTHFARRTLPAEKVRAARLVALVASARAGGTELDRGLTPWTVEFPLDTAVIAPALRLQLRQAEEAIRCLCDAGVLAVVRTAGTVRYRIAEEVYERSNTGDSLDWPAVLARLEGEPAAMLVARALVDLLPASSAGWGTVPLSVLGEHTGYGTITARKGKDVLVRAGLLEEEPQAGHTSRFRFSDFAHEVGSAPAMQSPVAAAATSASATPVASTPTASIPVLEAAPAEVPLQVGGLELRVPPGTSIRIEADAHGRQTIRVGSHLVIGPL